MRNRYLYITLLAILGFNAESLGQAIRQTPRLVVSIQIDQLTVSTIGDEIKESTDGESRVFAFAPSAQFPIIFYGNELPTQRVVRPVTTEHIAPTIARCIRIRAPNTCQAELLF
jgi:hypothetical protein